jgi:uncharacterized protein
MLLVKTTVKESTVPNIGWGLFADQDIPKGGIIWELNTIVDKIIPIVKIQYLTDVEKEYLKKYAYRVGDMMILCSDDGKYINHSDTPNVDDLIDNHDRSITIANREIKAGEELFSNYAAFDDDSKNGIKF